jgi:hypothetical protein
MTTMIDQEIFTISFQRVRYLGAPRTESAVP